jgi:hypothetical protein
MKHIPNYVTMRVTIENYDFVSTYLKEHYPHNLRTDKNTGLPKFNKQDSVIWLRCSKEDTEAIKEDLRNHKIIFSVLGEHLERRNFEHYYDGKCYNMSRAEFRRMLAEKLSSEYVQMLGQNSTISREQIELRNSEFLERCRKGEIKPDTNGTLRLPCGCVCKEIPGELSHVPATQCEFHRSIEEKPILKTEEKRKTENGHVQPEHVQTVLDLVRKNGNISFKEISRITGFGREEVFLSLKSLVKEDKIFIPRRFWKNQRRVGRKKKNKSKTQGRQPTQALTKAQTPMLSKQDAMEEISNALKLEGFSTPQTFGNCVFATRYRETGAPIRLFILVHDKESTMAREFAEPRISIIFHVSKFRQRLRSMMRWLFNPKPKPIGELNTDVLTSFGWHAYLNEDTRQDSLLAATNELRETHVAKVLLWLKNSWPMNPNMPEEYSFHVSQDYNWFRSNVGENRSYFRLKQKLLITLQIECRRLVREANIDLSEHTKSIERFFLITY